MAKLKREYDVWNSKNAIYDRAFPSRHKAEHYIAHKRSQGIEGTWDITSHLLTPDGCSPSPASIRRELAEEDRSMKHTPGPWTLDVPNYDTSFVFTIYGPNGEFIADTCHSTSMDRDKHARLIAAAPELLAALKDCVRQITALCSADDVPDSARTAIAKATG